MSKYYTGRTNKKYAAPVTGVAAVVACEKPSKKDEWKEFGKDVGKGIAIGAATAAAMVGTTALINFISKKIG